MANILTGIRSIISAALLFCPVFSPVFYVLYLFAGFTDMIDGTVARKTNTVSGFIFRKKYVSVHSVLNKVTGVLLFILPMTLSIIPLKYSMIPVCAVATVAAVQEGCIIFKGKEKI